MASTNPTNKESTSNNSRRQPQKRPRNNVNQQHPDRTVNGTHSITKRPITKPFQRKNDFYVTNKSSFNVSVNNTHYTFAMLINSYPFIIFHQAQLKQCNELLLKNDINEVFLHSVGNAIARCINLALTLVHDSNGGLGYEANTSTIQMIGNQCCLVVLA